MPMNDMEELAKIPDLVFHFLEHKTQAGDDFSFAQFLEDHYGNRSEAAKDQSHKKLPFFEHQIAGLIFVLPVFSFVHYLAAVPLEKPFFSFQENMLSSCPAVPWQPPRSLGGK